MASKEIRVPELGDFKDVAVIDVLVKPGEAIQVETPLLTLETEKATMDVPSTEAGTVEKIHVQKGSKVSAGSLIVTITTEAAAPAPAADAAKPAAPAAPAAPAVPAAAPAAVPTAATPAAAPPAAAKPAPAAPAAATPAATTPAAGAKPVSSAATPSSATEAHASPSVRRFARELGVDLGRVKGTGQKSRITDDDVKAFVKSLMGTGRPAAGAAPAPAVATPSPAGGGGLPKVAVPDFTQFGAIEVKPLNRVQRISGPRLHASWVNLPHVTQFDEADITDLEALRVQLKGKAEAAGIKLTPLAFIVLACVKALQQFPLFNTSLDANGQNLVYKKYIHIGFAADTPNGLLVPVIRDADHKDIYVIARALGELSAKARAGKLTNTEMQGGCFTISSLGGIGGTAFTPIINAPEVAILGVSKSSQKPVYRDGTFVPRLMLPLSLSYDHRVIDGANAARFTTYLAGVLAQPHGLIEAVL